MKKLRESAMAKVIAVILLTLCVLGAAGGGMLALLLENECSVNTPLDYFNYTYEGSQEFTEDVNLRVLQLSEYLKLKQLLETDGMLDYEKVLAVEEGKEAGEQETGEWETDGRKTEDDRQYTVSELLKYSQAQQLYPEDVTPDTQNISRWATLMHQGFYNENISSWGVEKITESNTIEDIAVKAAYCVGFYNYYKDIFNQNTNFRYWISIPGKAVLTNMEEQQLGKNPKETFENLGSTMGEIWDDTEKHLARSTMQADRQYIAQLESVVQEKSEDTVVMHIAVTKDQSDLFTVRKTLYERIYSGLLYCVAGVLVFGILSLIVIVFLFTSAGHKKGVEGIYLTRFDKWFTEIAAGICLFFGGKCSEVIFDYYEDLFIVVFMVGLYVTALISFSSLARRIKAGTLWSNSLTCQIVRYTRLHGGKLKRNMKEIWNSGNTAGKVVTVYIGILGGNILLFVLGIMAAGESFVFFILFFAAFLAGNFWMIQRISLREAEEEKVYQGVERIAGGELTYQLDTEQLHGRVQRLADAVNRIGDGLSAAVEQSIRDERMKTELITNVSHDVKTPLTSIINYIDLLKREQIEDEKVQTYLEVLDQKSQRLKNLMEDLMEASKLSSQNVELQFQKIDIVELVRQTNGEFEEKFAAKNLNLVLTLPENPVYIEVDGRRMWRVLENLYSNVAKYALENTRVYVSVQGELEIVGFTIKNISASQLNIDASELTERFIRGDVSRSTEGSGLGLSIAKSLTELMHGDFEIYLDGDLFRVMVRFKAEK